MISRNALYQFIEALVENAADGAPLKDAASFRNLRGSVDEAKKVVRVDCFSGRFALSNEIKDSEQDVDFIIECFVTPDEATAEISALEQEDAAIDLSFEMARAIFEAMAPGGVPDVCQAYGDEFDTDRPKLGTVTRGATYLYGKVNP